MERRVLFDTQFTEINSTEKTEAQGKISANEMESDNRPVMFLFALLSTG